MNYDYEPKAPIKIKGGYIIPPRLHTVEVKRPSVWKDALLVTGITIGLAVVFAVPITFALIDNYNYTHAAEQHWITTTISNKYIEEHSRAVIVGKIITTRRVKEYYFTFNELSPYTLEVGSSEDNKYEIGSSYIFRNESEYVWNHFFPEHIELYTCDDEGNLTRKENN